MPELIPSATPPGVLALIQNNFLIAKFSHALRPYSKYRNDARRVALQPHTGQTATHSRIGHFNVDLAPLPTALANPPVAQFSSEQYTAFPLPYGNSFTIDGPTAYVQAGDYASQGSVNLAVWGGNTQGRIARDKIYHYCGGTAIVRRAGTSGNTTLLVNTLAGFRYANGPTGMVLASATNPLGITIGATPNTVVGTIPINATYPDGPGVLLLGTALGGAVAAQTVVKADNAPIVVRPNNRTSTETIVATDIPTVDLLNQMRGSMFDNTIPPHEDGTYHLHCDASFMTLLAKDPTWLTMCQGMGPSETLGIPGGKHLPMLGITIFETPDSPGPGRGLEVAVGSLTGGPGGSTGVEPSGAAGTPGSSKSMQDIGLDTRNSSGVPIRRAIMTGGQMLIETYVDIMQFWETNGIRKVADINDNVAQYQMRGNGMVFEAGEVDGWVMCWLPALSPTQLVTTMTVQATFDYTLETDLTSKSGGNNGDLLGQAVPLKRARAIEYSFGA